MTEQLTEVDMLTFEERCALARKAAVGDRWRKRKQHEHFCQVLANDGHGNLRLTHWNGRVTHKWYHYLASEYEPAPAVKAPEPLDDDMIEISQMLAAARAHNLETEVVWSFGQDRAGGSSIKDAVEFALSEWDL